MALPYAPGVIYPTQDIAIKVNRENDAGNGWRMSALQPDSIGVTNSWTQRIQALRAYCGSSGRGRSLPAFFIVGPPRTGTSWLHEILKGRVALPATAKETRFFDVHYYRGTAWYMAHYPRSQHRRVGEVAPTYFASPEARSRIRELIPHAKIVCIFRDPVERLVSLYRLKRAYGWIPWSFEQALLCDPELTESNRYATHLRGWQQDFGVDHVLPTFFEDLRDQPQAYVNKLADFIGIPRFTLTAADCRGIHSSDAMTLPRNYTRTRTARLMVEWLQARSFGRLVAAARNSPLRKLFLGGGPAFADLPSELTLTLFELFRREVDELEVMVQRDLSAWKPLAAGLESGHAAA
jgi:hypothetical protein